MYCIFNTKKCIENNICIVESGVKLHSCNPNPILTVVIMNWLTVMKYPFLKLQWIFFLLHSFSSLSLTRLLLDLTV